MAGYFWGCRAGWGGAGSAGSASAGAGRYPAVREQLVSWAGGMEPLLPGGSGVHTPCPVIVTAGTPASWAGQRFQRGPSRLPYLPSGTNLPLSPRLLSLLQYCSAADCRFLHHWDAPGLFMEIYRGPLSTRMRWAQCRGWVCKWGTAVRAQGWPCPSLTNPHPFAEQLPWVR